MCNTNRKEEGKSRSGDWSYFHFGPDKAVTLKSNKTAEKIFTKKKKKRRCAKTVYSCSLKTTVVYILCGCVPRVVSWCHCEHKGFSFLLCTLGQWVVYKLPLFLVLKTWWYLIIIIIHLRYLFPVCVSHCSFYLCQTFFCNHFVNQFKPETLTSFSRSVSVNT